MESKTMKQFMDEYLPDSKLFKVHQEGLEANKIISARNGKDANAESDDFIEVPDHPTRFKYLDEAYKLKGYTNDKNNDTGQPTNILININTTRG